MKYGLICIGFVLANFAFSACATGKFGKSLKNHLINGSVSFANTNFSKLGVNGSLNLANSIVEDEIIVNGAASLENVQARKVKVNGALYAYKIVISDSLQVSGGFDGDEVIDHGILKVKGGIKCKNSSFNVVEIESDKCVLQHTQAKSISFKNVKHQQILQLENYTIVEGDVTFGSSEGIVKVDSTSKVLGKIVGGNLER